MITDGDAFNGTNLVFPLSGHDFSVGARDFDSSVKTSSVVSVSDDSTIAVVGANRAIVRALRSGVTIMGPSKGPGGELGLSADKSVFLFESKPRLFVRTSVHNFLGVSSEIGVGRNKCRASSVSPLVCVGHDDDVVALSEGISVVGDGLHDDLRVVCLGLITGGTIVVPFGKLVNRSHLEVKGSALGAESDATSVNPDVLGDGHLVDLLPAAGVVDVLVVEGKMFVVSHCKIMCEFCVVVLNEIV